MFRQFKNAIDARAMSDDEEKDISQNPRVRRSEDCNCRVRIQWNIVQGRFQISGEEIRTVTNDCGDSSLNFFKFPSLKCTMQITLSVSLHVFPVSSLF